MVSGSIHGHIATLAERSSRCVRLVELENKTPDCVIAALTATFQQLPDQLKQSLTGTADRSRAGTKSSPGTPAIRSPSATPRAPRNAGRTRTPTGSSASTAHTG